MTPPAPAPTDEPVVELGMVPKFGAFMLFTAGVTALFAGGQVSAMIIFRSWFTEWLPILQALAGLAACFIAPPLAYPRRWAVIAAVVILGGLGCAGLPWAMWLMFNGVFTALTLFSPGWAVLALIFVGIGTPEYLRVARARRLADSETRKLMAEAMATGQYGYAPAPPSNPWAIPAMMFLIGIPLGLFGLAMWAPAKLAWLDSHVRGTFSGRNPFGSSFVDGASDYPYDGSPLQWYIDYESRWVPMNAEGVIAVADDIANEVSWKLAAESGEGDPVEGERALWAAGRQKELPLWIAESLRNREVFYHTESLFSRSFDPEVHVVPDTIHLDCDQLAYMFLHVAWRLDLAMKAVPSPMHVYLRYDGPSGEPPLYLETTQFRSVDIDGNYIDFRGRTIGESFFLEEDYYSSGKSGSWASEELTAAAGLYQPWTGDDIHDSIVGNVLVGLKDSGKVPYPSEAEANVAGSRDITLVSNLYRHYVRAAEDALDEAHLDEARVAATRARELRAEFGVLVVYMEPKEEAVLATLDATAVDAATLEAEIAGDAAP